MVMGSPTNELPLHSPKHALVIINIMTCYHSKPLQYSSSSSKGKISAFANMLD